MSISGDWYSDLGSHMQLTVDSSGNISGWYFPAAGHVGGCYELLGRCDPLADPEQGTALGWTVLWRNMHGNCHSVTSWSGRYDHGTERICATWLLCMSGAPADSWKSTVVGQDVFTRDEQDLGLDESGVLPLGEPGSHPQRPVRTRASEDPGARRRAEDRRPPASDGHGGP